MLLNSQSKEPPKFILRGDRSILRLRPTPALSGAPLSGRDHDSLGCAGGNHCWAGWLNEFTAQPGALTVTAIELAYGSKFNPGFAPPNGTPVTVYLWTDPGNTGDPANAVVQRSVATTMANVDTDILNVVPIAPITLSSGQIFYVGAISRAETVFPASYDTTTPQHHSFEGIWSFFTLGESPNPNQLGSANGALGYDFRTLTHSFQVTCWCAPMCRRPNHPPACCCRPGAVHWRGANGEIASGSYFFGIVLWRHPPRG